jgi:glucose-6-phosphate isomerase
MELLRYDPAGMFLAGAGVAREEWLAFCPQLVETQREIVETDGPALAGQAASSAESPRPVSCYAQPRMLLAEYGAQRRESELHGLLQTADRLRELVDRVVVLGSGTASRGIRALFEACCDPCFNELSRAERGSRPRMYFAGDSLDNDALQGLLHLLGNGRRVSGVDERWAIVVQDTDDGTPETTVAFQHLRAALRSACGSRAEGAAQLVVAVSGSRGVLAERVRALGSPEIYRLPDAAEGPGSVLSAAVLLPAAILGLDLVSLLAGATAMNRHFRDAPATENIVLQSAGLSHLMATRRGATVRVLSLWAKTLEGVGAWYAHWRAQCLAQAGSDAAPWVTVNAGDWDSHGPRYAAGRHGQLVTNVIVDEWRCDPLPVEDELVPGELQRAPVRRSLPDLMRDAIGGARESLQHAGCPFADLHLPRIHESTLGQLLQMLMLATVVESRLTSERGCHASVSRTPPSLSTVPC